MVRKEKYLITDILDLVENSNSYRIELDGDLTTIGSKILKMFKEKGVQCACCKRTATCFYKEREDWEIIWHLGLYIVLDDGTETRMTKDHIIPKMEGGNHTLVNLRPMCQDCNEGRGSFDLETPPDGADEQGIIDFLLTQKTKKIMKRFKRRKIIQTKMNTFAEMNQFRM